MYLSVKVLSETEFNTTVRIFKSLGFTWETDVDFNVRYDKAKHADDFYVEIGYRPNRIFYHNGNLGFDEDAGGGHEILDFSDFISLFKDFVNDEPFVNGYVDFAAIVNNFKKDKEMPEEVNEKIVKMSAEHVELFESLKDRIAGSSFPLYRFGEAYKNEREISEAVDEVGGGHERETLLADFLFNPDTEVELKSIKISYIIESKFADRDGDYWYISDKDGLLHEFDKSLAFKFESREEAMKIAGAFGDVLQVVE